METYPEIDSNFILMLQASARVLTEPALWRCVSSFQRGIPMPLYTFLAAQDPSFARSVMHHQLHQGVINHIIQRVVLYGTPQLFAYVPLVWYEDAGQWCKPTLARVSLYVQHAIRGNRPEMLEWILVHHVVREFPRYLWSAALRQNEQGDVRILDVLHRYKPISTQEMREFTKRLTNTALVGWIATNYPEGFDPAIMTRAMNEDNVELAQCLHQHFPTMKWCTSTTYGLGREFTPYDVAIKKGRVLVLLYLVEKRPDDIDTAVVESLLRDGHSKVLAVLKGSTAFREQARELATRYIRERNQRLLVRLCDLGWLETGATLSIDEAAANGHLPIIKFLVERGLATATTDAMDLAAEAKHWDVVCYLHEHGVGGYTARVMDAAATQGQLEHVKFFSDNRSEGCTTRVMNGAAEQE